MSLILRAWIGWRVWQEDLRGELWERLTDALAGAVGDESLFVAGVCCSLEGDVGFE